MLPVTDEQAKLGQEIIKTIRASGSYVADILGDLPKDLTGLLVGDRIKAKRQQNAHVLWRKTKARLEQRRVEQPEPPSYKFAIPILSAAADENNATLQDLWARLLAAAMDPKRRDELRQNFVVTVQKLDPLDAVVLEEIRRNGNASWGSTGRDVVAASLQCWREDVLVSFQNLHKLGCISFGNTDAPQINPYLSPYGTVFLRALAD